MLERVVTIHCLEACGGQFQFIIKLKEVSGIKKITLLDHLAYFVAPWRACMKQAPISAVMT